MRTRPRNLRAPPEQGLCLPCKPQPSVPQSPGLASQLVSQRHGRGPTSGWDEDLHSLGCGDREAGGDQVPLVLLPRGEPQGSSSPCCTRESTATCSCYSKWVSPCLAGWEVAKGTWGVPG